MSPNVYVETSAISAYFDERKDVVSVAQRYWTRMWWDAVRNQYELVISEAIINELAAPNYAYSQNALALIRDVRRVAIIDEVMDIVDVYIARKLMPQNPLGDALHLALASYYKCDYLLTWNCKHLANPNKFQHIRIVNTALGLYIPVLVTPNQLIGADDD